MKLLSVIVLSLLFTSQPIDLQITLEEFVFSQDQLPEGCSVKQVSNSDSLPCNAEANPFVSSDREFLACFVGTLIRDSALVGHVNRALFSIYEDQAEIGIFGLETDSEKTAEQILIAMSKRNPNDNSSQLIGSGKLIIWLWKDQGENNSFNELKTMIKSRVE